MFFLLAYIEKFLVGEFLEYSLKPYLESINSVINKDISDKDKLKKDIKLLKIKEVEDFYVLKPSGKFFSIYASLNNSNELFVPDIGLYRLIYEAKREGKEILRTSSDDIGLATYIKPITNRSDEKISKIVIINFRLEYLKNILSIIDSLSFIISVLLVASSGLLLLSSYWYVKMKVFEETAFFDRLTQTYNRNFFYHIRDKIDYRNYAIAILDIDHFKRLNDTFGHDIGDKALNIVARIIKDNLSKDDILIRLGGEEFLLFIKKDERNIESLLEEIRRQVEISKIFIKDGLLNLSVSIGAVLDTDKCKSIEDCLKKADIALYRAKNRGRNRVEIYGKPEFTVLTNAG